MGVAESAAKLPPICIAGFEPGGEVDLTVTYPDGESESFTEVMDENGTAMVAWSAETELPEGAYTLDATQGDLSATYSVEVGPAEETQETQANQETTPQSLTGEPSIEVNPAGDSGSDFEIVLSGFEPNQEVPLTLYVAIDEEGSDYQELDTLSVQVDENGEATSPLEVDTSDLPSSLFALEYWPETGDPIYASFEAG
jgi:hypothetical protein